jgi:hypothetical protein
MKDNSKLTITRLFVGENGKSKFAEMDVPTSEIDFAPPAPKIHVSAPQTAMRSLFLVLPPNWFGEAHPAPNRQLMTIMQGSLEVVASDGVKRIFKVGDTALVEDTSGEGHATRNIENGPTVLSVVQF